MGRVSKAVSNRRNYTISKAVIHAVILPMVVFATQQALMGETFTAAGAAAVAATAVIVDYAVGVEGIPWSEDDLRDAAERIGASLESAADSVENRTGR